jgi:hypothetical protein
LTAPPYYPAVPRTPEIYVRKGSTTPPSLVEKLGIKAVQRILIAEKLGTEFTESL